MTPKNPRKSGEGFDREALFSEVKKSAEKYIKDFIALPIEEKIGYSPLDEDGEKDTSTKAQFFAYLKARRKKDNTAIINELGDKKHPIFEMEQKDFDKLLETTFLEDKSLSKLLEGKTKKFKKSFSSNQSPEEQIQAKLEELQKYIQPKNGFLEQNFSDFLEYIGFFESTVDASNFSQKSDSKVSNLEELYKQWKAFCKEESIDEKRGGMIEKILKVDFFALNGPEKSAVKIIIGKIRQNLLDFNATRGVIESFDRNIKNVKSLEGFKAKRNMFFHDNQAELYNNKDLRAALKSMTLSAQEITRYLGAGRSKGNLGSLELFWNLKIQGMSLIPNKAKKLRKEVERIFDTMLNFGKNINPIFGSALEKHPFYKESLKKGDPKVEEKLSRIEQKMTELDKYDTEGLEKLSGEREKIKLLAYIAYIKKEDKTFGTILEKLVQSNFNFEALSKAEQISLFKILQEEKIKEALKNQVSSFYNIKENDLQDFLETLFDDTKDTLTIPTGMGTLQIPVSRNIYASGTKAPITSIQGLLESKFTMEFFLFLDEQNQVLIDNMQIMQNAFFDFTAKNGRQKINPAYNVRLTDEKGEQLEGYLSPYQPENYESERSDGNELFLYAKPVFGDTSVAKKEILTIKQEDEKKYKIDIIPTNTEKGTGNQLYLDEDGIACLFMAYVAGINSLEKKEEVDTKKQKEISKKIKELKKIENPVDTPLMASETEKKESEKQQITEVETYIQKNRFEEITVEGERKEISKQEKEKTIQEIKSVGGDHDKLHEAVRETGKSFVVKDEHGDNVSKQRSDNIVRKFIKKWIKKDGKASLRDSSESEKEKDISMEEVIRNQQLSDQERYDAIRDYLKRDYLKVEFKKEFTDEERIEQQKKLQEINKYGEQQDKTMFEYPSKVMKEKYEMLTTYLKESGIEPAYEDDKGERQLSKKNAYLIESGLLGGYFKGKLYNKIPVVKETSTIKKTESAETNNLKEFLDERATIPGYKFPENDPYKGFKKGTVLWIRSGDSELPPKTSGGGGSDGGKRWIKMEITNVNNASFELKIGGGELKLKTYEGQKKTLPIHKGSIEKLKEIFGEDNIFKMPDPGSIKPDKIISIIEDAKKTTGMSYRGDSGTAFHDGIKRDNSKNNFVFTANNEQLGKEGDVVEYFGYIEKTYEVIPKDEKDPQKDQETKAMLNPIMYKVEHNKGKKTFTVSCNFQERENFGEYKLKGYSYEREMDYENFLLFLASKKLKPQPKHIAEKAKREQERPETIGTEGDKKGSDQKERRFKMVSLGSIFKTIKGGIKKVQEQIKEREKEDMERVEDFFMSDMGIHKKMSDFFGVFGFNFTDNIANAFDQSDAERYKSRQDRVWKKTERRLKIYEADGHGGSLVSERVMPIINDVMKGKFPKDRYKVSAALLYIIKDGAGPYRNNTDKIGQGAWIKAILGDAHHQRYLKQRDKYYQQLKDNNEGSIWKDQKGTDLVSLEMEYITDVIDGRYLGNGVDEYYLASIRGRKFAGEVNSRYKESKSLDSIKDKMGKYAKDKNSFDYFHAEYFRYMTSGRPFHAMAHLNDMCMSAVNQEQVSIIKMIIMGLMLSGASEHILGYEGKKLILRISRSMGFIPGMRARGRHSQKLNATLLNMATDGGFGSDMKYNISDFSFKVGTPVEKKEDGSRTAGGIVGFKPRMDKFQARWFKEKNGKRNGDIVDDYICGNLGEPGQKTIIDTGKKEMSGEEKAVQNNFKTMLFEDHWDNTEGDMRLNATFYGKNPTTILRGVVYKFNSSNEDEAEASDTFWGDVITRYSKVGKIDRKDKKSFEFLFRKFMYWFGKNYSNRGDVFARGVGTAMQVYEKSKTASGEQKQNLIKEANSILRYMTAGRMIEQGGPLGGKKEKAARKFVEFLQKNMDLIDGETMTEVGGNIGGCSADAFKNHYGLSERGQFEQVMSNPMVGDKSLYDETKHINPRLKRMEAVIRDKCSEPEDIGIATGVEFGPAKGGGSTPKTETKKSDLQQVTAEKIDKTLQKKDELTKESEPIMKILKNEKGDEKKDPKKKPSLDDRGELKFGEHQQAA